VNKVTPLFGGEVAATAEPRESVVAVAEELLEMARSGQAQMLAVVYMGPDNLCGYRIAGLTGAYSAIGAAQMVLYRLIEEAKQ
jgi:hypothetical protein